MPVITREERKKLISKSEGNDEPSIEIVKLYEELDDLTDEINELKEKEIQNKIILDIMLFLLMNNEIKCDMKPEYYKNLLKDVNKRKETTDDITDNKFKYLLIDSIDKYENKVIRYSTDSTSNHNIGTLKFLVGFYVLFFAVISYFYYSYKYNKSIDFDFLYN